MEVTLSVNWRQTFTSPAAKKIATLSVALLVIGSLGAYLAICNPLNISSTLGQTIITAVVLTGVSAAFKIFLRKISNVKQTLSEKNYQEIEAYFSNGNSRISISWDRINAFGQECGMQEFLKEHHEDAQLLQAMWRGYLKNEFQSNLLVQVSTISKVVHEKEMAQSLLPVLRKDNLNMAKIIIDHCYVIEFLVDDLTNEEKQALLLYAHTNQEANYWNKKHIIDNLICSYFQGFNDSMHPKKQKELFANFFNSIAGLSPEFKFSMYFSFISWLDVKFQHDYDIDSPEETRNFIEMIFKLVPPEIIDGINKEQCLQICEERKKPSFMLMQQLVYLDLFDSIDERLKEELNLNYYRAKKIKIILPLLKPPLRAAFLELARNEISKICKPVDLIFPWIGDNVYAIYSLLSVEERLQYFPNITRENNQWLNLMETS